MLLHQDFVNNELRSVPFVDSNALFVDSSHLVARFKETTTNDLPEQIVIILELKNSNKWIFINH